MKNLPNKESIINNDIEGLEKELDQLLLKSIFDLAQGYRVSDEIIDISSAVVERKIKHTKNYGIYQQLVEIYYIEKLKGLTIDEALGVIKELHSHILDEFYTVSCLCLLGIYYIYSGDYNSGVHFLSKSNGKNFKEGSPTRFFQYSKSIPFLGKHYNITRQENNQDINDYHISNSESLKSLILVSGDINYVYRFFDNYVKSIEKFSTSTLIHLHIIYEDALTDCEKKFLDTIISKNKKISVTTEKIRHTIFDKRSYYACSRFLVAKYVLKKYKLPIVITDLDYELSRNIDPFIEIVKDYDVGLQKAQPSMVKHSIPWSRVLAGCVFVNNTKSGHEFLEHFENLFHATYLPGNYNWGIDQNILTAITQVWLNGECINLKNYPAIFPFTVPYELKRAS